METKSIYTQQDVCEAKWRRKAGHEKDTKGQLYVIAQLIDLGSNDRFLGSNDRFGLQSTVRTAKEPNFLEQLTGMRGAHFPLSAASAPSEALHPV